MKSFNMSPLIIDKYWIAKQSYLQEQGSVVWYNVSTDVTGTEMYQNSTDSSFITTKRNQTVRKLHVLI